MIILLPGLSFAFVLQMRWAAEAPCGAELLLLHQHFPVRFRLGSQLKHGAGEQRWRFVPKGCPLSLRGGAEGRVLHPLSGDPWTFCWLSPDWRARQKPEAVSVKTDREIQGSTSFQQIDAFPNHLNWMEKAVFLSSADEKQQLIYSRLKANQYGCSQLNILKLLDCFSNLRETAPPTHTHKGKKSEV